MLSSYLFIGIGRWIVVPARHGDIIEILLFKSCTMAEGSRHASETIIQMSHVSDLQARLVAGSPVARIRCERGAPRSMAEEASRP